MAKRPETSATADQPRVSSQALAARSGPGNLQYKTTNVKSYKASSPRKPGRAMTRV